MSGAITSLQHSYWDILDSDDASPPIVPDQCGRIFVSVLGMPFRTIADVQASVNPLLPDVPQVSASLSRYDA